jgi:DeoR family glycerol-3-phosphate regulon repressor
MKGRSAIKEVEERQKKIVEIAKLTKFVSIEELTKIFSVTPQTIRRDINKLCKDGILLRHHGGATVNSSVENIDYDTRKTLYSEEKQKIAALVAKYIPDKSSIFINIGTTNEEIAKSLLEHKYLKIITNNLNIAHILTENPTFEVRIAGGLVRNKDKGIIGVATIDFIKQFKVDIGIIGISGIDEAGMLLDYDYQEVCVARSIIESSRKVILATDSSKFGNNAMVKLCHISEIDMLFTDYLPSKEYLRIINDANVQLITIDD